MQPRWFFLMMVFYLLLCFGNPWVGPIAGAEETQLAHEDVFGKLRRPAVPFDHEIHSERLADGGCGLCHHVPDKNTGKPVYIADEELGCVDCHGPGKENRLPALREAFHGSCTVCHRSLIKFRGARTGPTTCGGCHRKD